MKRIFNTIFALLIFLSFFCCQKITKAQELVPQLGIFNPVIGKTWTGHFQNPIDTSITHICRWEVIKNGNAVRLNKLVPEAADFSLETTYYWDRIDEQIKFLSITSNGYISFGKVLVDGMMIITDGLQTGPNGNVHYTLSLRIDDEGKLHDNFSSMVNGELKPGHFILYEAE